MILFFFIFFPSTFSYVFSIQPKTSNAVTVLSKYIISLIILSGWAIFESVLVERIQRLSSHPPPLWLTAVVRRLCPLEFEQYHAGTAMDIIEDVQISPSLNRIEQHFFKIGTCNNFSKT